MENDLMILSDSEPHENPFARTLEQKSFYMIDALSTVYELVDVNYHISGKNSKDIIDTFDIIQTLETKFYELYRGWKESDRIILNKLADEIFEKSDKCMFFLFECLENGIYKTKNTKTLIDAKQVLSRLLVNGDITSECELLIGHIKVRLESLIDINKTQHIKTNQQKIIDITTVEIKKPLTFAELFKYPHNQDIEQFKKKLKEINLIDDNYLWRTVDNNGKRQPIKDIGKFYDWLYSDTTVFDKTIDKTTHCICFCAEFGIIAYEGTKNKPETGRIVTAKLIRESTFDYKLKDKYNIHFKTWINKEK